MQCTCGKTIPTSIRHCPYCGAAVQAEQVVVPNQRAWRRNLARLELGFLGAVLLLGIILLVWLPTSTTPTPRAVVPTVPTSVSTVSASNSPTATMTATPF